MSPLLVESLKILTSRVNLATGISHPSDDSSAKEIFNILRREGEQLDASKISVWAMENGWQTNDANKLGELAKKIGNGGRVVVKSKGMWPTDIVAKLRARANESQT